LSGFTDRTGIATDLVEAGMQERPGAEIETCIYRIIQEATTNVVRHASATRCRIYLQRLPATVLLTIEDNGVGFEADHLPVDGRAGFGLLGIRERVAGFRGTFRIESRVGHGTRLMVELPALAGQEPAAGAGADLETSDAQSPQGAAR